MAMLFTARDLELLARPPRLCVADAATSGMAELRAEAERWEHRFRRGLKGFAAWSQGTVEAIVLQPNGARALGAMVGHPVWASAVANGLTTDDLQLARERRSGSLADGLAPDDVEGGLRRYDDLEAGYRRLHDARRDLVSSLWTVLLEVGGRDALEACLRSLASSSLMLWMEADVEAEPEQRLVEWSAVMRANFSSIRIEEDEQRFTITSDPCGSCTRQVLDGRREVLGDADVAPFAPEHIGADPLPIYRAHVGLMHWLMPLERIGRPWPVIACPAGAGTGPCTLTLEKHA